MLSTKSLLTEKKQKAVRCILFLGIAGLFVVTRFWQLAALPLGIHVDEAGMAYDAWCLSEYGVDRYLKPWPVYLTNFGSGQSSLYAFLCAFLFKIFGYSIWMMRIPAVFFSFLNTFFGVKIVRKIYPQKQWMAVAAGGLLTICPYFILAGRLGMDCNLMLGMSTVFLYCIITAVESRKISKYIWAGVTGGILLYTYALTYIIVPVFLILALLYLVRVKKFLLKGWAAMAVPMAIIAAPLILVQIVNMFDLEEFQLGCFTITKLQTYRVGELGHFQFDYLRKVWNSILWGDSLNYNSIPQYPNLYGITNIFFLLGIGCAVWKLGNSIKKRRAEMSAVVLLWLISIVVLAVHIDSNVNKLNGVFYAVIFFALIGVEFVGHVFVWAAEHFKIAVQKMERLTASAKCVSAIVLFLIYGVCFVDFSVYYFGGKYTEETYLLSYFQVPVTQALEFIEEDDELREKETQMAESKIVYAVCALKDPWELKFWENEENEQRFEKYRFNGLGEIADQNNYIVRDGFDEYCMQLRASGFREKRYEKYSLFYKK